MSKLANVIESRLELVKSAQRRSSLSYLIAVIIAASFILAIYNSLLSWDMEFCFLDEFSNSEVRETLQKQMIQNWVNNRMVQVDLLGLKLSASDFTIVGGLGLIILSIWFLLNVKRENSVVGTFLIESKNYEIEDQRYIYNYISSNQIFSNAFNEDKPIDNLDFPLKNKNMKEKFINRIDEYLFYLPGLAILLSILGDLGSLFVQSPFRDSDATLLYEIIFSTYKGIFTVALITGIGVCLCIFSLILNHRARKYEKATKSILKAYSNIIDEKITATNNG